VLQAGQAGALSAVGELELEGLLSDEEDDGDAALSGMRDLDGGLVGGDAASVEVALPRAVGFARFTLVSNADAFEFDADAVLAEGAAELEATLNAAIAARQVAGESAAVELARIEAGSAARAASRFSTTTALFDRVLGALGGPSEAGGDRPAIPIPASRMGAGGRDRVAPPPVPEAEAEPTAAQEAEEAAILADATAGFHATSSSASEAITPSAFTGRDDDATLAGWDALLRDVPLHGGASTPGSEVSELSNVLAFLAGEASRTKAAPATPLLPAASARSKAAAPPLPPAVPARAPAASPAVLRRAPVGAPPSRQPTRAAAQRYAAQEEDEGEEGAPPVDMRSQRANLKAAGVAAAALLPPPSTEPSALMLALKADRAASGVLPLGRPWAPMVGRGEEEEESEEEEEEAHSSGVGGEEEEEGWEGIGSRAADAVASLLATVAAVSAVSGERGEGEEGGPSPTRRNWVHGAARKDVAAALHAVPPALVAEAAVAAAEAGTEEEEEGLGFSTRVMRREAAGAAPPAECAALPSPWNLAATGSSRGKRAPVAAAPPPPPPGAPSERVARWDPSLAPDSSLLRAVLAGPEVGRGGTPAGAAPPTMQELQRRYLDRHVSGK